MLGSQATVGVDDALAHLHREVDIVADFLHQILQRAPGDGSDVERLQGLQCQRHRPRPDRIAQVVADARHFGADHGLEHIVYAAHRQAERLLDIGEPQTGLVLHQQGQQVEGAKVSVGAHAKL